MADNTDNRGFASMKKEDVQKIAAEGGRNSGGNFAKDPARASREGKKGNAAQPTSAKAEGGRNSHKSD
jgi:general stress protein YciG